MTNPRMHQHDLRKRFGCVGPVILPVIHVVDEKQVVRNVRIAIEQGAPGVFLINHDFGVEEFLPVIRATRERFPALWLGVNFLGVPAFNAIPVLSDLADDGCVVDGYWADDACVDESVALEGQALAAEGLSIAESRGWPGLVFGGVAFKKQRPVAPGDYAAAARLGCQLLDVVTTSGVATGEAADQDKVKTFRSAMGDAPLALASGVNPENFHHYAGVIDAALVATGINHPGDFYNIDPLRLGRLLDLARRAGAGETEQADRGDRDARWYLSLMAPRSRSEKYAWLDPSSAYINARAFHAMLDDLLEPFSAADVDVVAGFDAAGFVLGAAMADRLGKGFLTIRKGGKVPVAFDVVDMTNYSGKTQQMEMRKPAFAPGTRVLLVDQWIETGGTMKAGIELVERQQGVVAGIAAVCIEDTDASRLMRERFPVVSCVVPGSDIQAQCDRQTLDSFDTFDPSSYFPERGTPKA